MEKQLAEVRESWVKNWSEKQLDHLVNLYRVHADVLSADGSRAQDRGRDSNFSRKASWLKIEINNKLRVPTDSLSTLEPVREFKMESALRGTILWNAPILPQRGAKWLIVQHAMTAKP